MQQIRLPLLAALLTLPLTLHAMPDELSAPNDANGRIVLTTKPCDLPMAKVILEKYIKDGGEPLRYAYGINNEGKPDEQKSDACYFIPKINYLAVADNAEGAAIIPVVNIFVEQDGEMHIFPHLVNEFTPYVKETF
jgi:hypothetical protein